MRLLHFAHRAEAKAFIKHFDFKSWDKIENCYFSHKEVLCITEEGIDNALIKIPYILASFQISEIINFGIAGSLDSQLPIGNIYEIRTCYMMDEIKPRFQSYTTQSNSNIDLITSSKRVLENEYAQKLSCFAPIVDREAWSVGKISHIYKVPFKSIKYISDYAGKNTQCLEIRKEAQIYSERLLKYFLSSMSVFQRPVNQTIKIPELNLSYSTYQKNEYTKLMKILIKHHNLSSKDIFTQIDLSSITNSSQDDKTKMKTIIANLKYLINPVDQILNEKLTSYFKELKNVGVHIDLDNSLEKKEFKLQYTINSQTNINRLKRALDQTQFSNFVNIMDGNF